MTKRTFLRSAAMATVAATAAGSGRAWAQSERPGFFKAKDIAEAGFIYGLPIVMSYGVMYGYAVDASSGEYKAPFNRLVNEARVFTYQDTAVVTPNSDTPYSFAWLDLRAEPIVISVPTVDPKRYYSVQLNDLNTYNFGYIGTRATGSDAGSYLIAGPRWTGMTPAGIKKVFRSSTDFCLALFRTQLFDAADIDAVKKVQTGYKAQPLSSFLDQPASASAPALSFPKFEKDLVRTEFFEYLDFALQFAPALPEERWIREQLARIGVGPGKSFDFHSLSLEDKAEILLGMKEGARKVDERVGKLGQNINGWRVGAAFGGSAARDVLDGASSGEASDPFETISVRKDGTALTVQLTVSPLRDQRGAVLGGVTFCRAMGERKGIAEFLSRTAHELGTLFHLTERLQAARTAQDIYEAALEAITEALACERASILLFDSASVMRFVAWRGLSESYRKAVDGHTPWTPDSADAVPIFVADIRDTNEPDALKQVIEGEGIRGLAFIPLVVDGRVVGKFMTYYRHPHEFSEREAGLATTIARQLSLSLDRIRTEERLRESEARFRLMSEHAPVMIWISDAAGKCLHLNLMLRRFWSLTEADIPEFDWSATIHPEDAHRVGELMVAAISERKPVDVKGRYRNGDGVYRVLETVARPRFGTSGEFLGLIGVNVDVTERDEAESERRRAEAEMQAMNVALQESEERLRLATENAEVGFWDVDEVNQILHWPPLVKAMFGISPAEPVSMQDFYAGLHPEDRSFVSLAYAAAADPAQRALYDVEYRTVGKEDGRLRWVAAKGRGVFDAEGRCIRVTGTAIDITARKAGEARLKELNETLERRISEVLAERKLLADIVEGTDAFVQVVDLNFRWLAINHAAADEFERIFGIRPRAGDSMLDLLVHLPAEREAVRAVWARALAGDEFTEIGTFGDPGRERRHYEMKYNTLRNGKGERIGAYQFVYDVTDRIREQERLARAEEQLRQVQKMEAMGQLTGGVAHDFNNLLTPIVGALDALQRRGVGGEREQRLVTGALQSAERAKTLVQRLLAFARRQPLQARPTHIGDLIRGMGELIASTCGPQVKLSVEIAQDLPPAKVDENQLEMALLNLAVNARDAMPGGGTLRMTAEAEHVGPGHRANLAPGLYVRLSVADTGVGMDESVKARAIEPFFSTKGIGKGTGLGLSMAHGLASQLGGALTIQSRLDVGTNIEIWLPSTAEPVQADGRQCPSLPAVGSRGTALVVDDEDLVRATAADMLTDLGYAVVEAASAEEAIRLIGGGVKPQLLITDHLMTGMNGTDLARRVRLELPGTQVLLVSGYADSEGVAPDLPRMVKPFSSQELAAKLAGLSSSG